MKEAMVVTVPAPVAGRARKVAGALGGSRSARIAARAGLATRAAFYLLLAGIVLDVAFAGGATGTQANANGALTTIAKDPVGRVAIGAAAFGFLALGLVRIAGAIRDRDADRGQRLRTLAQGLFYGVLTWVPLSFLLGSRETGSEQAQHSETSTVLSWPGGRLLVAVVGLVVIGVCAYQIKCAVNQDFTDGMNLRAAPRSVRRLVDVAGTVGIAARALVFVPIGVLLLVAAAAADPAHAKGLDAELATLARQSWWGPAVLVLVAAGLVVFACYAALEARYRRVDCSS
ncbi:MAG: DUF1206 domain-containing protein [Frankiales bacterium]|nr:DUF1206 domain-containing protein [Frankiales bacterium]